MPGNSRTQQRAFQIERPIGKGLPPGRTAPHAVQCWVTGIPAAKSTPHQRPEKTGKRPDHHRRRQERVQTVQTHNAQPTRKQENVLTSPVIKEMHPKNKQKKTRLHFIAIRIEKLVKEWLAALQARHSERGWLAPAVGRRSPHLRWNHLSLERPHTSVLRPRGHHADLLLFLQAVS